jgi:hypothetical protein
MPLKASVQSGPVLPGPPSKKSVRSQSLGNCSCLARRAVKAKNGTYRPSHSVVHCAFNSAQAFIDVSLAT